MLFGLCNGPATFQRFMNITLSGLIATDLFVHLDDIVIYAESLEEHQQKFDNLMDGLRSANLKLQPDKCEFLRPEITYLGHIISENSILPDLKKISKVTNFPIPKNIQDIKQYHKEALAIVYFVTYCRHYLYGWKFKIFTDHKPLIWFQNSKDPCSRVTRWELKLSEYDFEMVYKAGKMNINADALSRNPADSEENIDGRSVNQAVPISNWRNNENSNNEIEYFDNTNLDDEGHFFQENTEEEDIDLTCNEEINYEIVEGNNNIDNSIWS